jgi:hypothetical protein
MDDDGPNSPNRWIERRTRARERLGHITGRKFYYPILGLKTEIDSYSFGKHIRLQKVIEPPGEVELAGALKDSVLFGAIGRYSHHIEFELAVDRDGIGRDDICTHMAWCVVSAIRIKTLAELLVPAVCDRSWSTIAAFRDGSCDAHLIEDVPMTRGLGIPMTVKVEDFAWIDENIDHLARLMDHEAYRTAAEALTTYHQHHSFRVMVALLWAGIESLFQINAELRFRLATLVALALEPRGSQCKELYLQVKKLYDVRSKAVHGVSLPDDKLIEHIREVRQLLSRLLCRITSNNQIPCAEDFDALIFEGIDLPTNPTTEETG